MGKQSYTSVVRTDISTLAILHIAHCYTLLTSTALLHATFLMFYNVVCRCTCIALA